MALNDEAHAASTMQLVPCKSSRLAIRPATTLARSPGKEFSCHGTYPSAIRAITSSLVSGSTPDSARACRQMGWPRRAPKGITRGRVPLTPRMTLVRSRSNSRPSAP